MISPGDPTLRPPKFVSADESSCSHDDEISYMPSRR